MKDLDIPLDKNSSFSRSFYAPDFLNTLVIFNSLPQEIPLFLATRCKCLPRTMAREGCN